MMKELKEELSTKQHSEFKVSRATDLKHRCWSVLTLSGTIDRKEIRKWAAIYEIPYQTVRAQINQFKALSTQS